jgi:hypothetical protein
MRKKYHLKLLFTALVIALSLATQSTQAQPSSISIKEAIPKVCRLTVDDAHISSSMFKNTKLKYLKINARSECQHLQTSVQILIKIYKVDSKKGDILVRPFDNRKGSKSGYIVEMNDAKILCVNNKPTKYYGVATAHVVIPGFGVFDRTAQSLNYPTLSCGT